MIINVNVHATDAAEQLRIHEKLDLIFTLLTQTFNQGKTIMANEQDALALLQKIDGVTTQASTGIAQEATSLQTVSDNLDKLIAAAQKTPGVPDSVMSALQAEADKVSAIGDGVQKQADFLKALASKGAGATPTDPAPVPVPTPTDPAQPVAVP